MTLDDVVKKYSCIECGDNLYNSDRVVKECNCCGYCVFKKLDSFTHVYFDFEDLNLRVAMFPNKLFVYKGFDYLILKLNYIPDLCYDDKDQFMSKIQTLITFQ